MKKIIFLIPIIFIIIGFLSCSQNYNIDSQKNDCKVNSKIKSSKADSLKSIKQFEKAISEYETVFRKCNDKKIALSISQCYAIINNPDSALHYLDLSTNCDSSIYKLYLGDFYDCLQNPNFDKIEERQFQKYESKYGSFKNREYAKVLMRLSLKDQAFYNKMNLFPDSSDSYWKKKEIINKQNLIEIEDLIAQYGWPKISEVGIEAPGSAFLIIQHCGDVNIMHKYIDNLKQLCEEKEANWSEYALMIDRINTMEGKKQIYGSQISFNSEKQIYYLDNVIEPDSLNLRREEVGLNNIEEYLKQWNAEFRK